MSGDKWDEASLRRLLCVLANMDSLEELLMFGSKPEALRTSIMCSDIFWWGTADAEEIEPKDLDMLEACFADLAAIPEIELTGEAIGRIYATTLYACRKRQMRPQGPWYGYSRRKHVAGAIAALFDACGPERTDSPKTPPAADEVPS